MDHNSRGKNCECPIWGTAAHNFPINDGYYVFYSPRAGGYFAINSEAKIHLNSIDDISKMKLSRYIYDMQYSIKKDNPEEDCHRYVIDPLTIDNVIIKPLLSYSRKKEAFFKFIIKEGFQIGERFILIDENHKFDQYDKLYRLLAATELSRSDRLFTNFCIFH